MEFYFDDVEKDVLVLNVDGGLNAETADGFLEQIEHLVDAGLKKIVVDCTLLEYISSYGVGVLLWVHKKMKKRGGNVKLCAIKGIVGDVLHATRMDTLFEVYPDLEAAKQAFAARTPA